MNNLFKTCISLSALTLGLTLSSGAIADSDVDVQPVFDIPNDVPVDGTATLTRTDSRIGFSIDTRGLLEGGTYTVWWAGFNHPENCDTPCACGTDDDYGINADETGASTFWATGRIADSYGQATFASTVAYGEFPVKPDTSFYDRGLAPDAEVQLFIRSHGLPLAGDLLDLQLTTFNGGCTEEPELEPELNECSEPQIVIFLSPDCRDDDDDDDDD